MSRSNFTCLWLAHHLYVLVYWFFHRTCYYWLQTGFLMYLIECILVNWLSFPSLWALVTCFQLSGRQSQGATPIPLCVVITEQPLTFCTENTNIQHLRKVTSLLSILTRFIPNNRMSQMWYFVGSKKKSKKYFMCRFFSFQSHNA